jgi:hypothetical protein
MFDPLTILTALAPTAVKTVDALVQRYIVPDTIKPTTVEQAVALENADIEKLKVITQADTGGETYKWVEAIRKLQRPVVVFATLAAFLYNPAQDAVAELFQVVMWYLFGERITPAWARKSK